jgi:hypothetical protein
MRRILPAALAVLMTGCGYIGGPQPPLANVPRPIRDLAAVQRGGNIIVQFTIPTQTTEQITITEPLTFDVRIGPRPIPFNVDQWLASAKQQPEKTGTSGTARYDIAASPWAGQDVAVGARVVGANGKASDWSNFVVVQPIVPPIQPTDLRAESTATGVRLTWRGAGEHFRVLRKAAGEQQFAVIAPDVRQDEFIDTQATVGTEYSYLVQAYVPQNEGREVQSDLSAEYKITPQAPPPATPSGLLAVPGSSSIELSWDSNTDAVTTGYRVYRATGDGAFEKLADVSAVPTYSDRAVEHGKSYGYSVVALDKNGRESSRSAPVSVPFP